MTECWTCYYNNGEVCINHCNYTAIPLIFTIDPYGKTIGFLTSMYNLCDGYRLDYELYNKLRKD